MSFSTTLLAAVCAIPLAGLTACVERVDAPLPVDARAAAEAGEWELAGTFGEPAELSVDDPDPWLRRYHEGGFLILSGIDAVDDELWACDMGISRLQIFDFDGKYLRAIGSGIPIKGTLPSDAELFKDYNDHNGDKNFWEKREGLRWIADPAQNFVAADIAVDPGGYWLADWTKTRPDPRGLRNAAIRRCLLNGTPEPQTVDAVAWPTFVTARDMVVAYTEPHASAVVLNNLSAIGQMGAKQSLGGILRQLEVIELMTTRSEDIRYPEIYARLTGISAEPGKFFNPGGLDMAFDKLLVCDIGNARIQVFDARTDDQFYLGRTLKIINARTTDGRQRFGRPRDLSVAPDGNVFILDADRNEVGILSPTFERIGTLSGDFGNAYAVDLSNDGRHCFVSDRSTSRIYHYARVD